jgi:hypothetical protein
MIKAGHLYLKIKLGPVAILLGLIILFYFLNGIIYLNAQSQTYDEGSFLFYATRFIKGHPERIYPVDNSKLPVIVLNLIPRAVSQLLHPGMKKTDFGHSDVMTGRYMTLLFSVLTILLAFYWSKKLYGEWAGLFSAFLVSICPNMLANAGLVTTDSYSAFALLITIYFLWKFVNSRTTKDFICFSFCISIAQLVKQSLTHLYILFPIILAVCYLIYRPKVQWRKLSRLALYFVLINWFVINLGFYFRDSFQKIGEYHFVSQTFQHIQQCIPKGTPVPFPNAYITGLDMSKHYDELGGGDDMKSTFGKITILGNSSNFGSFWYYYLVSLLFKTPLSIIVFIFWGMFLAFRYQSPAGFFKNEFFLMAPVLYFILYMSFFYKTQIGIRQIIFIFPFLYILCGILIRYLRGLYMKITVLVLSLFLSISTLRYWKNYIPYTNELISDKKLAYRYVGCSNLQFGQSLNFYTDYLQLHPEVKYAPEIPATGTFLIELDDYMDIWNLHKYDWISRIGPTGEVACNGLLITVGKEDLDRLKRRIP